MAVAHGVGLLQQADLVLDLPTWSRVTALSVAWTAQVWIPIGCLVGALAPLVRWRRQGGWIGLRALGFRGAALVPAALAWGLIGAGATGVATHVVEPAARRAAQRILADPGSRVVLAPGRTGVIGPLVVRPAAVQGGEAREVFFALGDMVGTAASLHRARGPHGPVLVADGGVAAGLGPVPWQLSFRRWALPVDPPAVRIELDERTTPDLAAAARRTEAAGRDAAGEWVVWWRRWLHPLAVLWMPLCLLPLGARRGTAWRAGAVAVGYLVAVRLGDHLATVIGALPAALLGPLWIGLAGAWAWARWRDR